MQQIFRQWIGMHRAMIAWYHAAHHVTKGTGFGGDHVNIYGEIYTQLDDDLDMIVEKGIGLTGDETLADPVSSLSLAATKLSQYPAAANQSAETIARDAFALSKEYVAFLESVYSQFEACGMSLGLDDLLQGLANQYETYVYLLQQRSRGTSLRETILRRALRKALIAEGPPGYDDYKDDLEYDDDGYLEVFSDRTPSGITSMAGVDRYADHRSTWAVMGEACDLDRDVRQFFQVGAERARDIVENLEDARYEKEDELYSQLDFDEFKEQFDKYLEDERDRVMDMWNEEAYRDLCSYVNVFSVPQSYFDYIMEYIYDDDLSPDQFMSKIRNHSRTRPGRYY